jgi:hypothetical protein
MAENGDGQAVALTCKAHSGIEEAIHRLDGWQKGQNGKIDSLQKEMSGLKNLVIGTLLSALVSAGILIVNLLKG